MNSLIKNNLSTLFTTLESSIFIPTPPITILAYHSISNDNTIVDIHPDLFKKQLKYLTEHFECISLDDVMEYLDNRKSFKKPAVALTFDDGYSDLIETVMPILSKLRIPASVSVLSDPKRANRIEMDNNKELMDIEKIQVLKKNGWIISCHSATHPNFADKTVNLKKEIVDAKMKLENDLGYEVSYFVYPKGIYSQEIIQMVIDAGYRAGFAFEPGIISPHANRFALARMPVDWTHTQEQFEAFFTRWGVLYLTMRHKFIKNILIT